MSRFLKLVSLVLAVGLLGGCFSPYVVPPPPDPYPYSFTDTSKQPYPQTADGARRFINDARTLWQRSTNFYVKTPDDSYSNMRGDCDDFATMIAYYLQVWWGYDTFILLLDPIAGGRYSDSHACAYVRYSDFNANPYSNTLCPGCPNVTYYDSVYEPVDFESCPFWNFHDYSIRWSYVPSIEGQSPMWKQALEWEDMYVIDIFVQPLDALGCIAPSFMKRASSALTNTAKTTIPPD